MEDSLELFFTSQLDAFGFARQNYSQLQEAAFRTIPLGHFDIRLQYNPARIVSTGAKLDETTLKERSCFLCPENMPPEQKAFPYNGQYNIFINPFPIFTRHFTVPATIHTPQLIEHRFADLLALARDFPAYTTFYNGPQCGASAPDHFHFQMVPRHTMPLEKDAENCSITRMLVQSGDYSVSTIDHYLRPVVILQASDPQLLAEMFQMIQKAAGQQIPFTAEPMLNLLAWYNNQAWTVCVFPRRQRRPWQFFAEGGEKILFSPGCVDMAGLIVAPRKEDFERYDKATLADLFGQVCIDTESCDKLCKQILYLLRSNR